MKEDRINVECGFGRYGTMDIAPRSLDRWHKSELRPKVMSEHHGKRKLDREDGNEPSRANLKSKSLK